MQPGAAIPPVIAEWCQKPLEPLNLSERNETLDVLRGFSLLGILLVNMALFSWPATYAGLTDDGTWTALPDRIADWIVRFLAEGKFYPLFSFLFGFGMAVQVERAKARDANFGRLFSRRLMVLFAIGMAHAFLVWEGDILMAYSLFGFLLLAFRNRRPQTLLIWAGIFLIIPLAFYAGIYLLMKLGSLLPEVAQEIERELAAESEAYAELVDEDLHVFSSGSWSEIFWARARNVGFLWLYIWLFAPVMLAMFLVGVWAAQQRILSAVLDNMPFLRRICIWGLVLGILGNAIYTLGFELGDQVEIDSWWLAAIAGVTVGGPALCLCYISSISLLHCHDRWRRLLRPIAAAGRMALSNYLLQSMVCTTIFYSYGLGLYGSVGRAPGVALALFIYAIQLPLSVWWLRRFQFGPAEWLWRTLTYRKPQPMLRSSA